MKLTLLAPSLLAGLVLTASPALAQEGLDPVVAEATLACGESLSTPGGSFEACDAALAKDELVGEDRALIHMLRGNGRLFAGDVEGASADADAILVHAQTPALMLGAAGIKLSVGEPALALNLAERALVVYPENPDALRLKGTALISLGRAEEAVPVLQEVWERAPATRNLASQLALAYLETGETAKAKTVIDAALRADLADPLLIVIRGRLSLDRKAYAAAIEDFTLGVEHGQGQNAYALRAEAYFMSGDLDAAKADLAQVVEPRLLPLNSLVLYAIIMSFAEEHERAAEAFELLGASDVMTPAMQAEYSGVLYSLERPEEARIQAMAAAAAEPKAVKAWLVLGHIAFAEDMRAALGFYRRAVEANPEHYEAQAGVADSALALQEYETAEKAFTAMLRLSPNASALVGRSDARAGRDDLKGAWKDLDAALVMAPSDPHVRAARGDRHFFSGEMDAARREYDAGLALAADDAYLLLSRASVFRDLGQFAAALRDLNTGLAAHPDEPTLTAQKGIIYHLMDDNLSAVEWLDKALALNAHDSVALWARGRAKSALGDAAGGAADTAEALRLNPNLADRI